MKPTSLAQELINYQNRPTSAASSNPDTWREDRHDDLVFATALACWKLRNPTILSCDLYETSSAADFLIGLDLGQKHDFSALAVLEKRSGAVACYYLRHLERLQLHTPYPVVAQRAQMLVAMTARHGHTQLVMDLTGVGAPVFDLLQAAGVHPVTITITGGRSVSGTPPHLHVPKRVLISTLAALFGSGRLKIAEEIPYAAELNEELLNFQVKIDRRTRQESYGAKGGRKNDDLVLALALAAFYAERN